MRTDAKKKRESMTITEFTTNTIRIVTFVCMVPALIICLPLIAVCGVTVFLQGFIGGMRKAAKNAKR